MLKPTIERFLEKISFVENGCWEWTSTKSGNGYGQFWFNKKMHNSHKISYEFFLGDIPTGLEIDHLCRNRICCNPSHLEAVTHKENTLRGIGITAINFKKTHCKNGHEFTPENIYVSKEGFRYCVICRSIWGKRGNEIRKQTKAIKLMVCGKEHDRQIN